MKSLLCAGLMLSLLGCSEDPVNPVQEFDPVDIEIGGEWAILFDTGVEWRLNLRQDSLCIEGFVQPDTTMSLFMEIAGKITEGTGDFRFQGRSWFYFHEFRCRMREKRAFDGGMKLFDIETNELIRDFSFSATRRPDREVETPSSLPAPFSSDVARCRPHLFLPSAVSLH
jgi:hypothetical protein